MLAKTYAAFKAAEIPEGSLPAGAEFLAAVAAIDRVLAVQVRDWVETFGDQAPKPPGWNPSWQARATLAAHRIFSQEAQANPAWRAGEKIPQKVRSGEWRLGYFPPGDPAGTLQAFDDAIAPLTPADFWFGRSRIMLDEVLIPVRCILAAREAEPGRRESRTTDRIEQEMRKDIAGRSCRLLIWPESHPTRSGTSRLTWQPDTVHLGRPAASPASAY
jgi:hypothetical protein